jgi:2-polyprenyl-3-methyl-5-hydroxy-6-metoxy-1,4-benzoquinol methylase
MIHYSKCPLCSSENTGSWLHVTDHFLSRESFGLSRCGNCGFIFTQDHPDENSIGRYYESEDYISHNDSAGGLSNLLYRLSRRSMLKKKRGLVRRISGLRTGNLLDIGSGTGHFLSEMKEAGWSVRGIEINSKAREFSASQFGLEVNSPEQISSLLPNSFDCITLWHVLEHFQHPFRYASEIQRLLKPGGFCIMALPNCSSYDAMHYKEFWAAYDVPRHLWHFTPETFLIFVDKAGFKLVETRSLPLDVFYISALSEKYRGSAIHFLKGMIKGFWFAVLSLFNKEKCSSMIYIIKKKNI